MPKMLQHVKTGEIWPMNPNLARHPDVQVIDKPDPQFAAAIAADDGATLGDVIDTGDAPVVTGDHEFEDVPPYVAPEGEEEEEGDSDDVAEAKAKVQAKAAEAAAAKKKAAAAKKRKAAAAKKKAAEAEAAAAAAEEESTDDEDDDDLDLDMDDLDDFE